MSKEISNEEIKDLLTEDLPRSWESYDRSNKPTTVHDLNHSELAMVVAHQIKHYVNELKRLAGSNISEVNEDEIKNLKLLRDGLNLTSADIDKFKIEGNTTARNHLSKNKGFEGKKGAFKPNRSFKGEDFTQSVGISVNIYCVECNEERVENFASVGKAKSPAALYDKKCKKCGGAMSLTGEEIKKVNNKLNDLVNSSGR
jgi:hypothetical protein